MIKRIAAATVWAPNGVSAKDWRYRGIFRVVLPGTTVLFFWFGIVGWVNGVSSVQAVAGSTYATGWSAGIAISSALWFMGTAFPKLWPVECVASIILIGLIVSYVALFVAAIFTTPSRSASAGLIFILFLLPTWRVGDIGFEAWQRGHPPHEGTR